MWELPRFGLGLAKAVDFPRKFKRFDLIGSRVATDFTGEGSLASVPFAPSDLPPHEGSPANASIHHLCWLPCKALPGRGQGIKTKPRIGTARRSFDSSWADSLETSFDDLDSLTSPVPESTLHFLLVDKQSVVLPECSSWWEDEFDGNPKHLDFRTSELWHFGGKQSVRTFRSPSALPHRRRPESFPNIRQHAAAFLPAAERGKKEAVQAHVQGFYIKGRMIPNDLVPHINLRHTPRDPKWSKHGR